MTSSETVVYLTPTQFTQLYKPYYNRQIWNPKKTSLETAIFSNIEMTLMSLDFFYG